MSVILWDDEKQFIRKNGNLIKQEKWDEFFSFKNLRGLNEIQVCRLYQFLMFEAGIDLLHKMSFIPLCAFRNCSYPLGDLVVPSNIKQIAFNAFEFCYTLTSVDLSKTIITELPAWCFYRCNHLKEVILPKTCEFINRGAFEECFHLNSINLDEVKEIIGGSLLKCYSLTSIKLNKSVKLIGNAFEDCPLTDIITPEKYAEEFKKNFPDANVKVI